MNQKVSEYFIITIDKKLIYIFAREGCYQDDYIILCNREKDNYLKVSNAVAG